MSCNYMEGLIPLVENGRFFDASMIRCRIDLLIHGRMEVQLQFDKEVSMQRSV